MPTSESPMLATVLRGWCFLHLVLNCTIVILKKCFVLVELIQVIFTVIYIICCFYAKEVFFGALILIRRNVNVRSILQRF
jgi:hypothetical protein